jgi:hypothetical protein
MGLFNKMKQSFGGDEPELMANGQLGRGVVVNVRISGASVQHGAMPPEQV